MRKHTIQATHFDHKPINNRSRSHIAATGQLRTQRSRQASIARQPFRQLNIQQNNAYLHGSIPQQNVSSFCLTEKQVEAPNNAETEASPILKNTANNLQAQLQIIEIEKARLAKEDQHLRTQKIYLLNCKMKLLELIQKFQSHHQKHAHLQHLAEKDSQSGASSPRKTTSQHQKMSSQLAIYKMVIDLIKLQSMSSLPTLTEAFSRIQAHYERSKIIQNLVDTLEKVILKPTFEAFRQKVQTIHIPTIEISKENIVHSVYNSGYKTSNFYSLTLRTNAEEASSPLQVKNIIRTEVNSVCNSSRNQLKGPQYHPRKIPQDLFERMLAEKRQKTLNEINMNTEKKKNICMNKSREQVVDIIGKMSLQKPIGQVLDMSHQKSKNINSTGQKKNMNLKTRKTYGCLLNFS